MRLLHEKFPNELVIISVHSAKFPAEKLTANIREAIMRHGLDHPVVNDANFQVWQSYAVKAWPTIVVIDPQGKIAHTQSGEILAEEFTPPIQALIDEFEAKGLLDRTPLDLRIERIQEPMRPLAFPAKVLLTDSGILYVADTGHHRLLEVQLGEDGLNGEILRVFGSGRRGLKDGSVGEAMFHSPHGMARQDNTLYVADTENHAIRAVDLDTGLVRTVAGTGEKAHGRYSLGAPMDTPLRSPWALLAVENIVFIAMAGTHQIWALLDEKQIGPFFGNGREALVDGDQMQSSFNQPSDLSLGIGHMFVADSEASAIRAIALMEKPRVLTLVGQGLFEFGDVDGRGGMVRLQHPTGLTFYNGLVYIADSYNHKIKTLDPTTGEVKTLIGTGQPGHVDGSFDEAELFEPEGVVAGDGRLYIADTNNHLIRIANLVTKTVQTLMLHGLEKLVPTIVPQVEKVTRLDSLAVGPGEVEVRLKIELPQGYKLNPDAPQLLQLQPNGAGTSYTFQANESPQFKVNMDKDEELTLNLTVYYCQTSDERLCLIHDARLILPLIVKKGAATSVQVRYKAEN